MKSMQHNLLSSVLDRKAMSFVKGGGNNNTISDKPQSVEPLRRSCTASTTIDESDSSQLPQEELR